MKKKHGSKFVLVVAAAVLVWVVWPGAAPEVRLADHIGAICEIARANIDTPKEGVELMFEYYGHQSPDILEQIGDLLVSIERIEDDAEHDARAAEAGAVLQGAFGACDDDFEAFNRAVEADPEAERVAQRGIERLARAVMILLGGTDSFALDHLDLNMPILTN